MDESSDNSGLVWSRVLLWSFSYTFNSIKLFRILYCSLGVNVLGLSHKQGKKNVPSNEERVYCFKFLTLDVFYCFSTPSPFKFELSYETTWKYHLGNTQRIFLRHCTFACCTCFSFVQIVNLSLKKVVIIIANSTRWDILYGTLKTRYNEQGEKKTI